MANSYLLFATFEDTECPNSPGVLSFASLNQNATVQFSKENKKDVIKAGGLA